MKIDETLGMLKMNKKASMRKTQVLQKDMIVTKQIWKFIHRNPTGNPLKSDSAALNKFFNKLLNN